VSQNLPHDASPPPAPGEDHHESTDLPEEGEPLGAALLVRGGLGGLLMGLANLVPGISGGTMLLASGVYPGFVRAIAELSTLRVRVASVALLGTVALAAGIAIVAFAGPVKTLVVEQRWIMYSLFIGMTLGGVPMVWELARPADTSFRVGAVAGFGVMLLMALLSPDADGGTASAPLLVLAGVAGASAMVLPGVSGGYLLLVLGQYVPILAAVDALRAAASDGLDAGAMAAPLAVLVPVGIGVVVGIVGVSNLVRWTLDRFPKATLGVLMGLLLGAVVGLLPFQESIPPEAWTPEQVARFDPAEPDKWPLRYFAPGAGQVAGALALVAVGLGVTLGIGRVGKALEHD